MSDRLVVISADGHAGTLAAFGPAPSLVSGFVGLVAITFLVDKYHNNRVLPCYARLSIDYFA